MPPQPSTRPVRDMLAIALPSVVTMSSYTVMQFIDGMMVSRIEPASPTYIAAQGNGGMAVFMPLSFLMGLFGVINTYVSQHLGAERPERGSPYAWTGLWMSLVGGLVMLLYGLLLPTIFSSLGHDPELERLETAYAQILCAGSVLTLCTRSISHFFYGLHRPMTVMVAALVGNATNLFCNALLIYGSDGMPEGFPFGPQVAHVASVLGIEGRGVTGAAMATLIGTGAELVIPLVMFLGPMDRFYHTRRSWRPSKRHAIDIWRIGWPGAAMFANEMVCWGYLMTVLTARFGPVQNSASWIGLRYMHLSFMPAMGISFAVTAMVGRCMGSKRPDLARRRAWLGMTMAGIYMSLCALVFVIFREPLIRVFIDADMKEADVESLMSIGSSLMIIAAVFQLFDAIAITMSAALRGAGDTIVPGLATIISSWVCIVGGGHLMIEVFPRMGALGPWVGAAAYIIVLGIFMFIRFQKGQWMEKELV